MKASRYKNVVRERDVLREANEQARTAAQALEAERDEARTIARTLQVERDNARAERDQAQREGEQAAELRLGLHATEAEAKRLEGLLAAEMDRHRVSAENHAIAVEQREAAVAERNRVVVERDNLLSQRVHAEHQKAEYEQRLEHTAAALRQAREQVRVLEDWQQRAEVRLNELAVEHGWIDCHTFRSEMEAFGLEVKPPTREYEVQVTVPIYVDVTVEAEDEDAAREKVTEDLRELVDEQAMLDSVRRGRWDMHEFDVTDVNEA